MKRRVNFFWILYGIVLAVLFLLSSTDLIIKEEEAEIYPISVIVGDTTDDNYVNFRKGMERAAIELNGDVNFITLYEKGSASQQKELILREQEDGSRALIIDPVEAGMLAGMQKETRFTVPVILINAQREEAEKTENTACITFDYYGMGRMLGEEIIKERSPEAAVYLLKDEKPDVAEGLFARGLGDRLMEADCEMTSFTLPAEGEPEQILEELTLGRSRKSVLAAANPESLLMAAELLADAEGAAKWVQGLYGRGNTVPVLNYLERGIIRGLCVTDDFSAGYLSVKTAVELAGRRSVMSSAEDMGYLESHYIRREDLRNEKYEKMLYPIE